MGTVLERVASQDVLLDAWNDLRRRVGPDGVESKEIREFGPDAARRIAEVSRSLLAGSWTPEPVRATRIPKADGGHRQLGIPPLSDRIVERAILTVLDPLIDPVLLPWSFAYRRGVGVNDALRAFTELRDEGARFAVRGDFADCFERVPHAPLLQAVGELVDDPDLLIILQTLVKRPITGRRVHRRGLHQGAPTSPMLTNLYLDRFDRAMLREGYVVVRYADDFVIPVDDEDAATHAVGLAHREAAALGMELGANKTMIHSFEAGVPFLGSVVTAATAPPAAKAEHPLATTVFVTTQDCVLRSRGHRMRVEYRDSEESFSIAYDRVRQVVVFGRAHLTTPFMQQLLRRGIDLSFLGDQGQYFGRLQGTAVANPFWS